MNRNENSCLQIKKNLSMLSTLTLFITHKSIKYYSSHFQQLEAVCSRVLRVSILFDHFREESQPRSIFLCFSFPAEIIGNIDQCTKLLKVRSTVSKKTYEYWNGCKRQYTRHSLLIGLCSRYLVLFVLLIIYNHVFEHHFLKTALKKVRSRGVSREPQTRTNEANIIVLSRNMRFLTTSQS